MSDLQHVLDEIDRLRMANDDLENENRILRDALGGDANWIVETKYREKIIQRERQCRDVICDIENGVDRF